MATIQERIRGWVNRALTQEVPFKVLSLLFALLIWAWVQTQQIVSQRTSRGQVDHPRGSSLGRSGAQVAGRHHQGPQGLVET